MGLWIERQSQARLLKEAFGRVQHITGQSIRRSEVDTKATDNKKHQYKYCYCKTSGCFHIYHILSCE